MNQNPYECRLADFTFTPCSGDAVYSLCLELERKGFSVWYDNRAADVTAAGMEDGVERSEVSGGASN
jgi:hypothetical protein